MAEELSKQLTIDYAASLLVTTLGQIYNEKALAGQKEILNVQLSTRKFNVGVKTCWKR